MEHIAESLGVGESAPRLGKRHVVSSKDKRELSEEAMALLARVYLQDLNLLQFPATGFSAPSRRNGTGAADVALRAVRAAKGVAKGKGKGAGKAKGEGAKAKGEGAKAKGEGAAKRRGTS